MASGPDGNPEDEALPPPAPGERLWTHPSEIGLAVRGSSDRRRSSVLATGVVLGGLGLLLSGLLLGSGDHLERASAESEPVRRVQKAVATVMVVEDGLASVHPGLVLDDIGHVVVAGAVTEPTGEIWVRCADRSTVRATAVAWDAEAGIGVVVMDEPVGEPPDLAPARAADGQEVITATATGDGIVTATTTLDERHGLSDGDETHWVFDRGGRLLGATDTAAADEDGALRRGRSVLAVARQLLDRTD